MKCFCYILFFKKQIIIFKKFERCTFFFVSNKSAVWNSHTRGKFSIYIISLLVQINVPSRILSLLSVKQKNRVLLLNLTPWMCRAHHFASPLSIREMEHLPASTRLISLRSWRTASFQWLRDLPRGSLQMTGQTDRWLWWGGHEAVTGRSQRSKLLKGREKI